LLKGCQIKSTLIPRFFSLHFQHSTAKVSQSVAGEIAKRRKLPKINFEVCKTGGNLSGKWRA